MIHKPVLDLRGTDLSMSEECNVLRFLELADVVALVKVLKVKDRGVSVVVDPIEVFCGQLLKGDKLCVLPMWGNEAQHWFKEGETSLILTSHDSTIMGRAGRMPVTVVDGVQVIESLIGERGFFGKLDLLDVSDRILTPWFEFRECMIRWVNVRSPLDRFFRIQGMQQRTRDASHGDENDESTNCR